MCRRKAAGLNLYKSTPRTLAQVDRLGSYLEGSSTVLLNSGDLKVCLYVCVCKVA